MRMPNLCRRIAAHSRVQCRARVATCARLGRIYPPGVGAWGGWLSAGSLRNSAMASVNVLLHGMPQTPCAVQHRARSLRVKATAAKLTLAPPPANIDTLSVALSQNGGGPRAARERAPTGTRRTARGLGARPLLAPILPAGQVVCGVTFGASSGSVSWPTILSASRGTTRQCQHASNEPLCSSGRGCAERMNERVWGLRRLARGERSAIGCIRKGAP